jgi:murein DD-endopeptidase MepM/ murein hydrolase activator NlpD
VKKILLIAFVLLSASFMLASKPVIPVIGATDADWNHQSFWYEPWGRSGVHKGIDIFGKKAVAVISPVNGVIVYSGNVSMGGNVIVILSSDFKLHYLAHLESINKNNGLLIKASQKIATLGDSGNAKGKQPHVHYSIASLIPIPWRFSRETQGWKKMFYVNPHSLLVD